MKKNSLNYKKDKLSVLVTITVYAPFMSSALININYSSVFKQDDLSSY